MLFTLHTIQCNTSIMWNWSRWGQYLWCGFRLHPGHTLPIHLTFGLALLWLLCAWLISAMHADQSMYMYIHVCIAYTCACACITCSSMTPHFNVQLPVDMQASYVALDWSFSLCHYFYIHGLIILNGCGMRYIQSTKHVITWCDDTYCISLSYG